MSGSQARRGRIPHQPAIIHSTCKHLVWLAMASNKINGYRLGGAASPGELQPVWSAVVYIQARLATSQQRWSGCFCSWSPHLFHSERCYRCSSSGCLVPRLHDPQQTSSANCKCLVFCFPHFKLQFATVHCKHFVVWNNNNTTTTTTATTTKDVLVMKRRLVQGVSLPSPYDSCEGSTRPVQPWAQDPVGGENGWVDGWKMIKTLKNNDDEEISHCESTLKTWLNCRSDDFTSPTSSKQEGERSTDKVSFVSD